MQEFPTRLALKLRALQSLARNSEYINATLANQVSLTKSQGRTKHLLFCAKDCSAHEGFNARIPHEVSAEAACTAIFSAEQRVYQHNSSESSQSDKVTRLNEAPPLPR